MELCSYSAECKWLNYSEDVFTDIRAISLPSIIDKCLIEMQINTHAHKPACSKRQAL
jgi:hypothetical protein